MADDHFEGWAILELMGRRRLAGYVTETDLAGQGFLRLDVPREGGADDDRWLATQFYSPSALYCLTPTSEETARAVAARSAPEPVHRWELPAAPVVPVAAAADDDDPWPDDSDEDLLPEDALGESGPLTPEPIVGDDS